MDQVQLSRWLFTAALSLAAGAILVGALGVAWSFLGRRTDRRLALPFAAITIVGAAVGAWAVGATTTGTRFSFIAFQTHPYLDEVKTVLPHVLFGAAILLIVLVGAGTLIRLIGPNPLSYARAGILSVTAAAVLMGAMGSLLVATDAITTASEAGHDPTGVVTGQEQQATLLGRGASFITGLAVAPTGEIFFVEHFTGRIGLLAPASNGHYTSSTFAWVEKPEDARLLHIEVHPDWPDQPFVYVTVQHDVEGQRYLGVVRLRSDNLVGVDPTRVISGLPTEDPARGGNADHLGSAIVACGGYLYVSVGDTDSPGPGSYRPGRIRFRAQLPTAGEGKILRYRLNGADLLPDGVIGADPPVFAMGFRNVFSMGCDPATNLPIAFDNGETGYDQVRLVEPGSNHEWPLSDERTAVTRPLYSTGVTPVGAASVAVRAGSDASEVIFGGFNSGSLYRFAIPEHPGADVELFVHLRLAAAPLAMDVDPGGCLFVADASGIWKIDEPSCPASNAASPVDLAATDAPAPFDPAAYFQANCAGCHGLNRTGAYGPGLNPDWLTGPADDYVRTILGGRPGTVMPAWSLAGLTEEEARLLVDYLLSDAP